jgi:uncharacterized protein YegL
MRLTIAVAVLLVAGVAHAQKLGPVDWIFLVDTSKSMRGVGKGTKDVFGDVKASIDTFVREANDGDTVTIYTFDSDARLHSPTTVVRRSRTDLHAVVDGLRAEGNRTHLGAAIAKGLARAASLPKDATRSRAVVLFTDGKEDVKGIQNPTLIAANVANVGDSFVYFVSMGEHEPQLDAFASITPRTKVLKAPTVKDIRDMARRIRATIPPPPPAKIVEKPAPPPPLPPPPKPSPFSQALKIAIPLVLVAAIALAFLLNHRKQNRLEGELEILHPATPDSFIGLPKLQAREVALSAILPIDLGGRDARLFVRRTGRKKKVWISARDGSLRVNDVATPETELYDADTIQIGDAKLRFNRVGDERQEELS